MKVRTFLLSLIVTFSVLSGISNVETVPVETSQTVTTLTHGMGG